MERHDAADERKNMVATGAETGSGLTHERSASVPVAGDLKRMRNRYGYDSPVGRRCSNILEIMDGMPRPPEDWIDYLMPDWVPVKYTENCRSLTVQTADLLRLLAV